MKQYFSKNILVLGLLATSFFDQAAQAADYKIDSSHSKVAFKIKHLAISNVDGRFADFDGMFSYDPANISASKTDATIAAKSIDTSNEKRDTHLKSDEFFNAVAMPELKFVSRKIEPTGKDTFKILGDLTLHGVTKPVTLDTTFNGSAKDPFGNERAGFSANTKINRKDFGLTWSKLLETGSMVVGDEVAINIEIEGIKQS